MSRTVAVLCAAAAVAAATGSEIRATIDDSLRPVTTSMGLAVANSWIAAVEGPEHACDQLRRRIDVLRHNEIDAMGGMHGSEAIGIEDVCFVRFDGSETLAEAVAQEPRVKFVEPNFIVTTQPIFDEDDAVRNVKKRKKDKPSDTSKGSDPLSWGLNRIDQSDLPLSKGEPFQPDYSGDGVNIYVVDTGLNVDHNDFVRRGRLGPSFVPSEKTAEDYNGHGSHCAGTAAGTSFGVATGANIIGVKVLSGGGSGSNSGVIQGIKWAVEDQMSKNGGKAGVISLSLGGGRNDAINEAVTAASKSMLVVIAAGNNDADACRYSPASAGGNGANKGPITVGSTDSSDRRSSFSNYGNCVDIFAPGTSITSAWKGGVDSSNTISGTSMATPHVAGVAALMLEKNGYNVKKARDELFKDAAPGRVSDAKTNSNKLLQVPVRNGGPPTPMPTRPPTLPPPQVCVGSTCTDFVAAKFGPKFSNKDYISGKLVEVKGGDSTGCSEVGKKTYKSSDIVLIKRGGCDFFNKVKAAADGGAMAVIHYMNDNKEIFAPNYYGKDSVDIPSFMISFDAGSKFSSNSYINSEVSIGQSEKKKQGLRGEPSDAA